MLTSQNIQDINKVSPTQESMYFYSLFKKGSTAFLEQMSFTITGSLDVALIAKSLDLLVDRYDVLRTVFNHEKLDKVVQVILRKRELPLHYEDLTVIEDKAERGARVTSYIGKDRSTSFDLAKDMLMRVALFRVDGSEYVFVWSHHHILMDGWCKSILVNDFFMLYQGCVTGVMPALGPVQPYKSYIEWLEKQDRDRGAAYWKDYLSGFSKPTGLPGNTPSTTGEGYTSGEYKFSLSRSASEKLSALAAGNSVTLNTVIQVIWGLLLAHYNGVKDIVYGGVVAGRPKDIPGVESIVGLFVNAVPIRISFTDDSRITDLLRATQRNAVGSESFQYLPLAEVQSGTELKQQLLDHIFVFENYPGSANTHEWAVISDVQTFGHTNYDFNIFVIPGSELTVKLIYNSDIYDDLLADDIRKNFTRLADEILQPGLSTAALLRSIWSENDQRSLLQRMNSSPEAEMPAGETIVSLLGAQARLTPERICIRDSGGAMTYGELEERSDRLAYRLREMGVSRDELVPVCMERGREMMTAILGIWKAGAAYVPLDPSYPGERKQYILEDTQAKVWMNDTGPVWVNDAGQARVNDAGPGTDKEGTNDIRRVEMSCEPGGLAYVIYTSGSTGRPKGAMIEHRGMLNHLYAKVELLGIGEESRIAQNALQSFDISVWQMWAALIKGGEVIVYENELLPSVEKFIRRVREDGITILEVVPSYLSVMLDTMEVTGMEEDGWGSLQWLMVTGEELKRKLVERWMERYGSIRMVNAYGPTEASDDITHYCVKREGEGDRIPIGKPVRNMQIYIMDDHMRLCPVGVKGEICVSGVGVGRGYWRDEERTGKVFVEDPFRKGVRMYRTGDVGCWRTDGNISYYGRRDYQVKVRGHRIELGEIEYALSRIEGVREAVVIDREDSQGNTYLQGYVVMEEGYGNEWRNWRELLSGRLPVQMIPRDMMELEAMPLTENGKIDRRKLPEINESIVQGGEGEVRKEASGEVEEVLAEIWKEVLGVKVLGVRDNFFELGGHSLKATQVASRIKKRLGVKFEIESIFEHPTIEAMSGLIEDALSVIKYSNEKKSGSELKEVRI